MSMRYSGAGKIKCLQAEISGPCSILTQDILTPKLLYCSRYGTNQPYCIQRRRQYVCVGARHTSTATQSPPPTCPCKRGQRVCTGPGRRHELNSQRAEHKTDN